MSNLVKEAVVTKIVPSYQRVQERLQSDYAGALLEIGSYFQGPKIGTGLTPLEKRLLIPILIGVEPNERDFSQKSEEYFINKRVRLTNNDHVLDISLYDNNKEFSETNLPLNIEDYVTYKWLINHPWFSTDKNASSKRFTIINPEVELKNKYENINKKDKAYDYYLIIKKNKNITKARMILFNDSKGLLNVNLLKEEELFEKLHLIAQNNPDRFINLYEDKDIEIRYRSNILISKGLITRNNDVNNNIVYQIASSEQIVGVGTKQFLLWYKDKANQQKISVLEAQAGLTPEITKQEQE